MRLASCFLSLTFISSLASPAQSQSLKPELPCPLLGADFPAPKNLSSSPAVQLALRNLTNLLKTTTATGKSIHGSIPVNTTTFSISIFSTDNSPNSSHLFEYHHTSPTLANVTAGVHTVDANSIYRIGSLSKLFTVYTFLVEVWICSLA